MADFAVAWAVEYVWARLADAERQVEGKVVSPTGDAPVATGYVTFLSVPLLNAAAWRCSI